MNWGQIKDHVSHICLAGVVLASWSLAQEMKGLNSFVVIIVITNNFVTEFRKFNENMKRNLQCPELLVSFNKCKIIRLHIQSN